MHIGTHERVWAWITVNPIPVAIITALILALFHQATRRR